MRHESHECVGHDSTRGRAATRGLARAALAALAITLAAACDSGGPTAVPASPTASVSATVIAPTDEATATPTATPTAAPTALPRALPGEVVYVDTDSGMLAVHLGAGRVTGAHGLTRDPVAFLDGRLYTLSHPALPTVGQLRLAELDPITLQRERPLTWVYERDAGVGQVGGQRVAAPLLLPDPATHQLVILYSEQSADGSARFSLTIVDPVTGTGIVSYPDAPVGPLNSARFDAAGRRLIAYTESAGSLGLTASVIMLPPAPPTALEPVNGSIYRPIVDSEGTPWGVSSDQDGRPVLVDLSSDRVIELPAVDGMVEGLVGSRSFAQSRDGRSVYFVSPGNPLRLFEIPLPAGKPVRELQLPGPDAVAEEGGSFLDGLAGAFGDLLFGTPVGAKEVSAGKPVLSPDGSRLYFFGAQEVDPYLDAYGVERTIAGDGIWVVDTARLAVIDHLRPGELWDGALSVSADGSRLFVIELVPPNLQAGASRLHVLDAETGDEQQALEFGFVYEAGFAGFNEGAWWR